MTGANYRLASPGVLAGVLALVAAACAPAPAPSPTPAPSKETEAPQPTVLPTTRPETLGLKIGLPVHSANFLPIHVAAEHTFEEEGLNVELVAFTGEAPMAQALVSDSVDIAVASPITLINVINAGHRAKGFYAGFNQTGAEWLARPEIKTWAGLKGKSVAIGSYGALYDLLNRHVLRKHGLESERDVQAVQVPIPADRLQALRAGSVDAAILTAPFKWQAEAEGFTRLGTQATEVSAEWPNNLIFAQERFLDEHPNTVRAFLRAHVKAVRLAKTDRGSAIQTIMKVVKFERQYAERTYDEFMPGFDERGMLPAAAMPVFWEIAMAAGEVSEPWPEGRFFDRRFVDTFDQWAPK